MFKTKIFKLDDIEFYVREIGSLVEIYHVETKKLILFTGNGKAWALNYINKRLNDVRESLDRYRSGF